MGSLQLEPSWEVIQFNMNSKVFALAADADAEADAQFLGYAGHHVAAPLAHAVAAPLAVAPAPNCVTEDVILVTQVCTPAAEEVCSTETVATQEIEYEKVCTEIVDTLCDAPVAAPVAAHYIGKREAEADAEADPQYFAHAGVLAHHAVAAPLAHAVAAPVAVAPAPLPVA